jgi:prepilin-type N-terminal cleavage/methylation domain-containing protein
MYYRLNLKKNAGFSLIEALVAASIFAVLSMLMLQFFIQGANVWYSTTYQSDLRSVVRNAMQYMTRELKNATRTSSQTPSPNLTIPSKPNNNSIDFYLPADLDGNGLIIDPFGNTEWDKSNKIQYQYIPGLKQLRRLEKGNHYIIATDVSNIEFEDNSINPFLYNDELRIILTLERTTPQRRKISFTMTSIVKLRNK